MGLDFESLGRVARQGPELAARMGTFQSMGEEAMTLMSGWLAEGSVGHMPHQVNRPEFLAKAHWPSVDPMVSMVAGDDYDRIFVVFGQGHIPILRQLVIDHPDYCVEDPLPYLEGL